MTRMSRAPSASARFLREDAPGPAEFRAALLAVAPTERDAWLNAVLGLGDLPEDGPELPRECVPYLPCSVDALLRVVDAVPVRASDVFVDVGSGLGRAVALVHLLSGAAAIGLEIQHALVLASRDLAARVAGGGISIVEGDAATLARFITTGSIFFLYCPFSGARLSRFLDELEPLARARLLRICCVDVLLPPRPWLVRQAQGWPDLTIYRTTVHGDRSPEHRERKTGRSEAHEPEGAAESHPQAKASAANVTL
jgi:SAM-dependent methyltransferase